MPRKKHSLLDKLTQKATYWIGTTECLLLHAVIFLVAFVSAPFIGFDKILLITTTLLSWEAIFLAIFIQMAVNKQHYRIKGIENDIDDILEDTEGLTSRPIP